MGLRHTLATAPHCSHEQLHTAPTAVWVTPAVSPSHILSSWCRWCPFPPAPSILILVSITAQVHSSRPGCPEDYLAYILNSWHFWRISLFNSESRNFYFFREKLDFTALLSSEDSLGSQHHPVSPWFVTSLSYASKCVYSRALKKIRLQGRKTLTALTKSKCLPAVM